MSNLGIRGGALGSGTVTLLSPTTNTNRIITLPDETGTLLTTSAIGTDVQAFDATIVVDADIGTTVQAYDADLTTLATNGIGTSANQLVQLDGTAKLPAVDGSNLTGIPIASLVVKLVSYSASNNDIVVAGSGGITITLPASPSVGDSVTVKDGTGNAATTNWTVARNGANIASSALDLIIDTNWIELRMTYINTTIGWSI